MRRLRSWKNRRWGQSESKLNGWIRKEFMSSNQLASEILPAADTDLPAIARLAGIIWRLHYPGIISPEQIEYMLAKMYSLETLREDIDLRAIHYERLLVGQELAGFAAYG